MPKPHNNLGNASCSRASSTRPGACYEQALALRPDYAEAHYHRADLKTFRAGDRRPGRARGPGRRYRPIAPRQDDLRPLCARQGAGRRRRLSPRFEHWLQGNALKRREVDYDEAACQQISGSSPSCSTAALFDRFAGGGRSVAGSDLRARHAPLRQHARRADPGQPSTGPRRRRTEESRSRCPGGGRLRRPAGSLSGLGRRRSTPTACGDWAQAYLASLPALAERQDADHRQDAEQLFLCRLDSLDFAPCPDHPHHARPGRYVRFVFLQALHPRSDVQLRPGRVGPLLPLVSRVDGPLAIGSAGRRHARRCRTKTWSTIWRSKPGG